MSLVAIPESLGKWGMVVSGGSEVGTRNAAAKVASSPQYNFSFSTSVFDVSDLNE
jgi:hypothetical protein